MAGVKTAKAKVEFFELPEKKVEVRYIKRQKGLIRDKNHVAYGGLLDGSTITLPAVMQKNGQFANVLTKAEKEFLENILALPENNLSVYKKDGFWSDFKIRLTKEGKNLDLSNPLDYIAYKSLLGYKDLIAPNLASIEPDRDKASYRFVLVEEGEEVRKKIAVRDTMKEAYKLLGKVEDDKRTIMDYFLIKGQRVPETIKLDALKAKIGDEVENNTKEFVAILSDTHFMSKVLLIRNVQNKVVFFSKDAYFNEKMEPICKKGERAVLDNAVAFIEDPLNQEYRMYLKAKLDEHSGV
jgi:hypothetical protein